MDILIENSRRILRAGFGVNCTESTFFDVIELLRQHPCLKKGFLEQVASTLASPDPGCLDPGYVPRELIELVAHEMRWNELLDLARRRVNELFGGDSANAIGDVASTIAEACSDDWDDRVFYKHYQESKAPGSN